MQASHPLLAAGTWTWLELGKQQAQRPHQPQPASKAGQPVVVLPECANTRVAVSVKDRRARQGRNTPGWSNLGSSSSIRRLAGTTCWLLSHHCLCGLLPDWQHCHDACCHDACCNDACCHDALPWSCAAFREPTLPANPNANHVNLSRPAMAQCAGTTCSALCRSRDKPAVCSLISQVCFLTSNRHQTTTTWVQHHLIMQVQRCERLAAAASNLPEVQLNACQNGARA